MASVRGPTDDATSSDPPLSPLSKRFFRIRQFRTRSSGWRKQPHPHGVTPPPFPCLRVYYWRTPRNIIGKTKSAHLFLQYGSVKTEERFTTFGRNAPTGIPNSLAVGRNTFWFFFPTSSHLELLDFFSYSLLLKIYRFLFTSSVTTLLLPPIVEISPFLLLCADVPVVTSPDIHLTGVWSA